MDKQIVDIIKEGLSLYDSNLVLNDRQSQALDHLLHDGPRDLIVSQPTDMVKCYLPFDVSLSKIKLKNKDLCL